MQQQQQTQLPYFDANMLSPNTTALLDSIAMGEYPPKQTVTPATFAPSALFPVPGRDTPEDSSPDSVKMNNNNLKEHHAALAASDDGDAELQGANEVATHKRKASRTDAAYHDADEEDDSLSDNGHEDKRQQGNDSKSTRAARRKSGDGKPKAEKSGKSEQFTKAQRRKEQNRAAQKAFRERREAKVRDLEAKVAELEAKSFGTSVENENLRSIVKRLQEENIALKEAQFTFTMPVNGAAQSINGQQTPTPSLNQQQAGAIDWSQFASFGKASQMAKPPSPPQSVSNDSLRSVHDNNSPPLQVHRASTGSASESQEAPSPSDPNAVPTLFGNRGSNSFDMLKRPAVVGSSPNDQLSTPSSIGTNKDDVEALFRSLYPNGIPNGSSIDSVLAGTAGTTQPSPMVAQQQAQSPYTFLSAQPGLTSFADSSSNMMAKLFEPNSYRDSSTADQDVTGGPSGQTSMNSLPNGSSSTTWADLVSGSQNDFLSSLSSTVNDASETGPEDDAFMKQLEQLIQSGNVPFNNAGQPFSPTNYLNMSPSPLQSLSNSQTPRSTAESSDNLQSPHSDGVQSSDPLPQVCGASRIVHVVGEDGRVMRPSEVWTKMGLNSVTEPQDLLIDDLCDQFKGKATCKDGKRYMTYSDLVDMQYARDQVGEKPVMVGAAPDVVKLPPKDGDCEQHDPAECQAKANELFLKANAQPGSAA